MKQGDEIGILFEFLLTRMRGNSSGWDVDSLPHSEKQTYPCYGFSVVPGPNALEQGGSTLYANIVVNVMAIGSKGVNDIGPIRAAAREIIEMLHVNSADTGVRYGDGCILESICVMPIHMSPRDEQGRVQHYLGHRFQIKVQPDGAHS